MLRLTRFIARSLDTASRYFGTREPEHLAVARRGEMEAYFHLREQGYRIVAKNFRTPHNRGEIDLIGWDHGVLCFVEVKSLARTGLAPPEMAVDRAKKQHILSVARRYVRRLPGDKPPACRFDIVSVVLGDLSRHPVIRLYKGAFSWAAGHQMEREPRYHDDRRHWWRRR
jgi:putative endonuclease